MLEPTVKTVKALFGLSGNQCAFTGCAEEMVHFTPNEIVTLGQVCHIKGERPGAKRYDRTQTAENRRSYENLILLCTKHHVIIDGDERTYTVGLLREMKKAHESKLLPRPPEISDATAKELLPIDTRTTIQFESLFEEFASHTGISRSHAQDVVRNPDKAQQLVHEEASFRLSVKRVRVSGRDFFLLVASHMIQGQPYITWALKLLPDLATCLEGMSPLDMLRKFTARFGVDMTVGTTTSRFIEYATADSYGGGTVRGFSFGNPLEYAICHVPIGRKVVCFGWFRPHDPPRRHEAGWLFAVDVSLYRQWIGT